MQVELREVRVPVANLLGREGDGFRIAQSRLGRGRIHHCMRAVGLGERCLAALLARATDVTRQPFGRTIAGHASTQEQIAESRCVSSAWPPRAHTPTRTRHPPTHTVASRQHAY